MSKRNNMENNRISLPDFQNKTITLAIKDIWSQIFKKNPVNMLIISFWSICNAFTHRSISSITLIHSLTI